MVAGFSFLSRITKYICEKLKIFDYSWEHYNQLAEDGERQADVSNIDNNCSQTKMNVLMHQTSVEMEISR